MKYRAVAKNGTTHIEGVIGGTYIASERDTLDFIVNCGGHNTNRVLVVRTEPRYESPRPENAAGEDMMIPCIPCIGHRVSRRSDNNTKVICHNEMEK